MGSWLAGGNNTQRWCCLHAAGTRPHPHPGHSACKRSGVRRLYSSRPGLCVEEMDTRFVFTSSVTCCIPALTARPPRPLVLPPCGSCSAHSHRTPFLSLSLYQGMA
jgi:hypothetical protein